MERSSVKNTDHTKKLKLIFDKKLWKSI